MSEETHEPERERVLIEDLGPLIPDPSQMSNWPNGDFLLRPLLSKYGDDLPTKNPNEWRAMARKALLKKFGGDIFVDMKETDLEDVEKINRLWDAIVSGSNGEKGNDLVDLVCTGGLSNSRKLQWALMDCVAGCQFKLHAHPNIELVYCVQGELHEIRMDGEAFTKQFSPLSGNESEGVEGPSLFDCTRSWRFGSLRKGNWLVNEVGSIHKSFTATNGEGCVLLCLWGGSHANIPEELPLVTNAVNLVDERLGPACECDLSTGKAVSIPEVFLPESEKSKSD